VVMRKGGNMTKGRIHAATVEGSERLQKVLDLLRQYKERTTLQIIMGAGVCAVNSIIAELRENGYLINCRCVARGCFAYSLIGERVQ
jgi:hypothetical protein